MPVTSAKQLLEKHWDRSLPVDVMSIARAAGAKVVPDGELDASGLFELLEEGPRIKFNSTEARVRQRFTVAHELGHYALKHGKAFRDQPSQFSTQAYDPDEVAANRFAAALLMPEEAVSYLIRRKGIVDIAKLAKLFDVSQVAMQFRLKNLGWL